MNPIEYYQQNLETYLSKEQKLDKQMAFLSLLRVLVFLITGLCIYVFFGNIKGTSIIALIGVGCFLFLLLKYTSVKNARKLNKALIEINKEELKIASGDFYHRDQGLLFQDPNHFYSLDIDLFGRGSFFQYLNRTTLKEGTQKLAETLKANKIEAIELRQEAVKELAGKPHWRHYYSATSSLILVETSAQSMIAWLLEYRSFLTKAIRWMPLVFSVISLVLLGLTIFDMIDKLLIGYWLLIGLGITGIYVKKINNLSSNSDKVRDTFRQYALLLEQIEKEVFTSELLQQKKNQIRSEGKKASVIFKEFSRALDALDNRNNLISAIFGNGFFLVDLKNSYRIEQWISQYAHKVPDWFEAVSFFDAYNSLGTFAFNHPRFVYPEIKENGPVIQATQLGHPLLDKDRRIDNDLQIKNKQFFIITGANMAGKSTFLRTVSLHIIMANTGLPVCAVTSHYRPVKLITSMRTSDSLTDDSSYFFSELKRLKIIVDAIKKEPYFVVLDEILKGTNSTDKAIGSRKFVEKLVVSKATGIIATHDLSLCDLEQALKEVKNYYFDAEIVRDELHFDYTLKEGICKNMNASFLLKKMDIV